MSSSGEQMALPPGSSYSTMHPVTKSVPPMHCQHKTCPSDQTSTGLVSKMALGFGQVHFLPGWLRSSIPQTIIRRCLIGLKGWKLSSAREVYGQLLDSMRSAKASNVYQAALTVAAASCYSASQHSWLRSLSSKNSSLRKVIYVIFVQNSIAS